MIVCIEGADGCGKTTVAATLAARLRCEVIAFPNDNAYTGPMIRAYLKREWHVRVKDEDGRYTAGNASASHASALAFQGLQIANRMELMPRLRKARMFGSDAVLARYWQSAWVYGQLDGLSAEWLESVHDDMVKPHVNILLSAPAEVCMERRAARDGAKQPEIYEGKLERTRRIVGLYEQLWASRAWDMSWRVVDTEVGIEGTMQAVYEAVEAVRKGETGE